MLDLIEEFRSLIEALEEAGVEFAVCGGLAVAVHALPRATLDIDLLLPRDQIDGAREVARRLGYGIEAGHMVIRKDVVEIERLSKPDPETGDPLSLDLLVVTPALASAWATRERVAWEHGTLPVVSRSGLVCAGADSTSTTSGRSRATMSRADMSTRAVTVRLRRTAQLRRLCLALARARTQGGPQPPQPGRPR